MYKLGIDVGGTNTDGVLSTYEDKIIAKVKTYTTDDISTGINNAIKDLIKTSNVDVNLITHAMLGTTQCTNSIVESKGLTRVVTIRIAGGATKAIKPFTDWPTELIDKVNCNYYLVKGGYEYDGKVIEEVDEAEIIEIVKSNKDIHNYAISCVYSPLNSQHENIVKEIILKNDPLANVSISSEIGSLSLLERENATILNSALKDVIVKVIDGFNEALKKNNIKCNEIYLCQNDGTIMNLETSKKYPILTISSGPTNSIRGGVKLAQLNDAIIVDVGGTTTDVGIVVKGVARETHNTSEIGGVTTNFRMPDMISIGIGGGTIVKIVDEDIIVGPQSVGHDLQTEALIFGGEVTTLTDIAVKLGKLDLGDSSKLDNITLDFANKVNEIVMQKVTDAIDLLKTSSNKTDIIFVGGGSVILDESLNNDDNIILPDNFDVANAIGASIASVSGSHEGLYATKGLDRSMLADDAVESAKINAVKAGAIEDSLEIVDIEQSPLSYHPEEAFIIKTKVVGTIKFD